MAREIFGLIPMEKIRANVLVNCLNSQTGRMEDQVIVSALIVRSTMSGLNFRGIDPSDYLRNFIHNMKFTKTRGFEAVEKMEAL